MNKKRFFILLCLWAIAVLSACESSQTDPNAQATQIAAKIFTTQTAEAAIATQTPTHTPTPTLTSTSTSTPSPTLTPTPTMEKSKEKSQVGETISLATDTPTPTPTSTPTTVSIPSARVVDNANLRSGPGVNYPVVGASQPGETLQIIGRDAAAEWWQVITADGQTAWINAGLVEVGNVEEVPEVAAPPPPAIPTPSQQWLLINDSSAEYPGPIQDRKWWYLWSEGRNNFIWQDMAETPECYQSPNEMTLAICPDRMKVDTCEGDEIPRIHCSRGDAALLWKAREGGTYRFEWFSSEVDEESSLWFYKHLDFVGSQGPGTELPYSAIVEDVIQWELFFWVPQYDTPYRVKVYKLVE